MPVSGERGVRDWRCWIGVALLSPRRRDGAVVFVAEDVEQFLARRAVERERVGPSKRARA